MALIEHTTTLCGASDGRGRVVINNALIQHGDGAFATVEPAAERGHVDGDGVVTANVRAHYRQITKKIG